MHIDRFLKKQVNEGVHAIGPFKLSLSLAYQVHHRVDDCDIGVRKTIALTRMHIDNLTPQDVAKVQEILC